MQLLILAAILFAICEHYAAENNDVEIVVIHPSQLIHIEHNGELEFEAFNNHYELLLQKHSDDLFSPHFYSEIHTDKGKHRSIKMPNCHYHVIVLSDVSSNLTNGMISLCNKNAIRGWIKTFNQMLTIEPKPGSTDNEYTIYKREINSELFPKNNVNIRRRISSQKIRYVELAVVNDPGMISEFGSDSNYQLLEDKTVSSISLVQSLFLNTDWGQDVGQIKIVLSSIIYVESFGDLEKPDFYLTCSSDDISDALFTETANICDINYMDYLSKFQQYRVNHLGGITQFDNAQLFSYYNFHGTVQAYSSLPGMCMSSSSGGIIKATYDDEFTAILVAYSLAQNFGIGSDSVGNNCEVGKYIMSSRGPYENRPHTFSTCSIQYLHNFITNPIYFLTLKCLDNKPSESLYSYCGNGIIEQGEDCDCGQYDCTDINSCCDGYICAFKSGFECSNDDLCCDNCMFTTVNTVCRELNSDNTCDIEAEVCDGISSKCPMDTHQVEGTKCEYMNNNQDIRFGYCYNGKCVSLEEQCEIRGVGYAANYINCGVDEWILDENECSQDLLCANTETPENCIVLDNLIHPNDGTPCNLNTSSSPAQCVNYTCQLSMDIYTYIWKTYPWDLCSISCKEYDNDNGGIQKRKVECVLQDGTIKDNYKCQSDDKPIDTRKCNDFVCLDGTDDDTDHTVSNGITSIMLIWCCLIVSFFY
eukprot:237206_1